MLWCYKIFLLTYLLLWNLFMRNINICLLWHIFFYTYFFCTTTPPHCCTISTVLRFTVYIMPWHFLNANNIKKRMKRSFYKQYDWADYCHFKIISFHSRSVKRNFKVGNFFNTFMHLEPVRTEACPLPPLNK